MWVPTTQGQTGTPLEVTPPVLQVALVAGDEATQTLALTNTGTEGVAFGIRGMGGAQEGVGPLGSGYSWTDSREMAEPFVWDDIADRGTPVSLPGDDVAVQVLPFPFLYYGVTYQNIGISPHGFLTFGTSGQFNVPTSLPSIVAPPALIAPLWHRFNPDNRLVYTYHDATHERLVVQYELEATIFPPGTTPLSGTFVFQVHLYKDGRIRFYYRDVAEELMVGTVGLQDDFRQQGVTLADKTPFLTDSLIVSWDPVPEYVTAQPSVGWLEPAQTQTVTLHVDARRVLPGVYHDTLRVATSSSAQPVVAWPLQLTVNQGGFPFRIEPGALALSLVRRQQGTTTFTLFNDDPVQAQTFQVQVRGNRAVSPLLPREREDRGTATLARRTDATALVAYSTNLLEPTRFMRFALDHAETVEPVALSPPSFAGDFLYGDDTRFYIITHPERTSSPPQLQVVDVATGQRAVVGPAQPADNGEVWTGLAADPTDGSLYGCTVYDNHISTLYTVDPATGEATAVGGIGGGDRAVVALAIDPMGQMVGLDIKRDELLRINKTTGEVVAIGPIGFDANGDQGLDYDPATGMLYLASYQPDGQQGAFRVVDPATAATTVVSMFPAGTHLGYLALPSGSFLTPDVHTGRIGPGESQQVPVTFDAGNLLAGTYETAVEVAAFDQAGRPTATVPVTFTVRSSPRITLRQTEQQFGSVAIGASVTEQLIIQNTGFDVLEVALRVNSFVFGVGDLPVEALTIPPGAARVVPLWFKPLVVGPVAETLRIESNDPVDPVLTVLLRGEGIPPPTVDLQPDALKLYAAVGYTQEQTVTLRNTGPRTTSFTVTPDTRTLDAGVMGPLLEEDFNAGIPASWSVVDHAGSGVRWRRHSAFSQGYANYTGGTGEAAMISSHAAPNTSFDATLRTPLLTAFSANLNLRFRANFITAATNRAFLNLDLSVDNGVTWSTVRRWAEDLGDTFAGPGVQVEIPLVNQLEAGDRFRLRWRYFSLERAPTDFYAQIDEVSISAPTEVLTVDVQEGTLIPGEAADIHLQFNPDGLLPGTYDVGLEVTLDEDVPGDYLPLVVRVVDETLLLVQPGRVNPNDVVTVPLRVVSPVLKEVTSYAFEIHYDSALLTFVEVETNDSRSETATGVLLAPGRVQVEGHLAASSSSSPEGVLLNLGFRGNTQLGVSPVSIQALVLNAGALAGAAEAAEVEVVPRYGDVDFDLAVTYTDAALVTRTTLNMNLSSAAARAAADVDGDGKVTQADATLIRQYVEGHIACFPAAPGCMAASGNKQVLSGDKQEELPPSFVLGRSYPNPARRVVTIPFSLAEAGPVELTIYNALGQPVRQLLNREVEAGPYTVEWNGQNDAGVAVASGVYFYRLQAGQGVATRQMVLMH